MQTTDSAGLIHVTYYNQNREAGTEGTVALSQAFANGVAIKQVSNTWINWAGDGMCTRRAQPQLATSTETTRELNNTVVTTVTTNNTYDGCGYPTQTIIDLGGGHKKTTVNQYTHDTTNWRLGLVTRTDVTSESPGQLLQTRTASFTYDGLGRLTTEVVAPGTPLSVTTTYANYDAFGHWTQRTVSGPDITSRSESQTFDPRGLFVASKTNALGHITTFAYDERIGQPTRITDPNLLVTRMDYDGFGRKVIETRPDNTSTRFTYSTAIYATANGSYSIQIQTDGAGDVVTVYDMLGRPLRTRTQAFGGTVISQDTTYDTLGRVTQKTHPYFTGEAIHVTTFGYDILGRGTRITEPGPGNRTTTTTYNGLTTTVTSPPVSASPSGQSKTSVKDVQGRTVSITDNAGTVQYQYDAVGNLTQVTGVGGSTTAMQYDARGRKTAMQDPDMGSWTYGYNVLGELKWQRDAKGQVISMTYDKLGRLLTKTTPDATSTWTYDTAVLGSTGRLALGKPATAVKSTDNYSETYTYTNLGLTETSTINAGSAYTVRYDYDSYSRVKDITYPNTGFKVRQHYDAYGYLYQVNRVTGINVESLLWQTTVSDAHARVVQEMFGNGLSSNRVYNHETGDLETIKTGTAANPTGVQNLSYTFDAIDNLLTRTDTSPGINVTETFTYDTVNRLTRSTVQGGTVNLTKTYTYSAAGNITSKSDVGSYTYGSSRPHAVTQVQGSINTSYTYDANGNQLSGGGRTIIYTAFNKPKTITGANGTTTFYYDVNDNRFQKSTATKDITYVGKLYERVTTSSLTEHKHYIYGGKNLVATYTERNNGTNETRYVHTDHLDSVNVITDGNGNVVERLSFDPHGKRRNTNGSDATGPITSSINRGYTRHEHDDEVGLINMNARLYDPIIGRFISPDTIIPNAGNSQAYNRYTYVKNNPLSLVDPTGRWSLKKHVKAMVRAHFKPSIRNHFEAIRTGPFQKQIDKFVLEHKWAYRAGQWAAGILTAPCGGCGAYAWSAYYTMAAGGSSGDAIRAAGAAYVSDLGNSYAGGYSGVEKVAIKAITAGVSNAITGGSFADGIRRGAGGAVLDELRQKFAPKLDTQNPWILNAKNEEGYDVTYTSEWEFGRIVEMPIEDWQERFEVPIPARIPIGKTDVNIDLDVDLQLASRRYGDFKEMWEVRVERYSNTGAPTGNRYPREGREYRWMGNVTDVEWGIRTCRSGDCLSNPGITWGR